MLGMEEVLCELNGEERNSQGLPPGFRFHPTDEELLTIYLASKLRNNNALHAFQIAEVDLNRCEPWDLPDVAKMGEREWYFFSFRDRKYPTGLRTNRATGAGYWKATGKDKEVYSSEHNQSTGLIGMKKTLVFYKGRAPRGHKTKWVMHEYRLHQTHFSSYRHTSLKEEWVICRIHHKTGEKKSQPCLLDHQGPPTNCLPALLEYCHDQSQNYPMHTMHMQQQDNTNFLIHDHQQNDLKTLISNSQSQSQYPLFHPINNGFQIQPSFLPTTPTNTPTLTSYKNNPSSPLQSILFKSLFSHEQQQQDSTSHHGIPKLQKQCKTEDNCSSHLEMPAANVNYPNTFNYLMMNNEKDHQNPWLFDNLDYTTVFGFSPAAASAEATTVDHADTSPSDRAGWAFRPSTFDTVPPNLIKLVPAESWPMPMDHASA